jgi:diguanylate cyclase (GGDEF)-like protein/PAS domain S-box-containing protein
MHATAEGAQDSATATRLVLAQVSAYLGWPLAHAFRYDASTGHLEPTMIWHQREPSAYQAFVDATAEWRPRADDELPGRVLATGRPAWASDLSREATSPRAAAARVAGIRTGLAAPVPGAHGIAFVLEFFSPESRRVDDELLTVAEYIGSAWGRALRFRDLEEGLKQNEDALGAIVASATDAIVVADQRGRIVSWNPSATRIFGYNAREAIGQPVTLIVPEQYRERHRVAFAQAAAGRGGAPHPGPRRFEGKAKDGRAFPIELTLASWHAGTRHFAGIIRDIRERSAAEQELRLLASAAAHLREAIVVSTGGDSGHGPTILYVNAGFTRITGYSEAEVLGRSFGILSGPKTDQEGLQSMHQRMRAGETAAVELVAYRKDRSDFLMEWQASPIYDPDGTVRHYASIQRDITDERNAQHALGRADRDALTGLPNREVLEKRLRRSVERSSERDDYRYALLFLDLDGFKAVNDECGHIVGDQLLISAAERLGRTIRPGDTVARFGGDEFVVLLEYVTGIADVIMVADRIQRRLEAPFLLHGRELQVGASIGVALSESGYVEATNVIRDADAAMYEAKRRGKGRVEFFDQSLYSDVVSLLGLREDLRRCLERDELEVHYQPLVDLEEQSIVGFEALVRWRHPELGLLLPDRFIPLAEETGFIVPMGRWILETACREALQWQHTQPSGAPLILSVNVSMRELSSADFVGAVSDVLSRTGFDAARLQLELTESVFVETLEPIRSRIAAVRSLGVTVCIDDFGTGYSSLGHLHRFPIDKIKIDRLFVRNLDDAPGNREILRTILMLARNLGLDVVAEGVESDAQLSTLRDMACGFGQGFLFSGPVSPEQVSALFNEGTADPSENTEQPGP